MYAIISNTDLAETSFVELPDDTSDEMVSILKTIGSPYHIIGIVSSVDWEVDPSNSHFVVKLKDFLKPSKFIQIYGQTASKRTEVKLNGRKVGIDPCLQRLTQKQFELLLSFLKQNDKNQKYVEIMEDKHFFDSLIVIDILK